MATLSYSQDAAMGTGAPNSPPDMTSSKSSKSSSFHSSTLSDVITPNDLSHFEEINLDDVQGALGPSSFPMPDSLSNHVLYEAARTSLSGARSLSHSHASHSFRDLTATAKPRYPSLKGQVNNTLHHQTQLHAPTTRSMRRGFTSPSAPSLANTPSLSGRRSRSPSPSIPRSLSRRSSSRTLAVASPQEGFAGRRQSWQLTARKTAKQREAECDDDGDDEVPEELMIPNVPISPRPFGERSPVPSACSSPPDISPHPSSRAPSLRSASPAISPGRLSQPPTPNLPGGEDGFPPQLSRQRTNTWEDTYQALDEDARKVTEALEEFQSEQEREQEIKRQQPTLSRSSSLEKKSTKAKPNLPPLRKSDPLIDPLQPSAEKEKHLSRTRPSWLPPKDPLEEKKHLKEYAKIQARVQEALREQARKEEEEKLARERVGQKKADLWQNVLLPKYATEVATPTGKKTYRQLWWSGIPPMVRGAVWKTAIGNELEISETTYKVALEKAKAEIRELGDRALNGKASTISENTSTVFPELKMFGPKSSIGEEQPLHQDLVNVCLAYSSYRPDVDTLTGIHHIAGLLLLNMSVPDTFLCLGNLLNRPLPLSFFIQDDGAMTAAYDITLSTLSKKAPTLARRLEDLRVEPRDYLRPMFTSLFCDRLPVEHAARLMDVYAIEGDKIATRAAVGLLCVRENRLYLGGVDDVIRSLESHEMKEHPDDFMAKIYDSGKSS
ncbi:hypothetical protein M011DRAFT_480197 [Sporormia fimetaria CBS 119925]|uniref:Rab-GAP TBC domain-containing protein n=1 Tax=Sporormia fimetaria CBS 119925 TaxID=1340428 RepID=A0A6A6V478_9PLEO|nr:hypothetical protein M011DRAFT_480197 [Sporormia fimetaria CBS 119925]